MFMCMVFVVGLKNPLPYLPVASVNNFVESCKTNFTLGKVLIIALAAFFTALIIFTGSVLDNLNSPLDRFKLIEGSDFVCSVDCPSKNSSRSSFVC